jgi:hypothetical protein
VSHQTTAGILMQLQIATKAETCTASSSMLAIAAPFHQQVPGELMNHMSPPKDRSSFD